MIVVMKNHLLDWENWSGTAAEMVSEVAQIMQEIGMRDDGTEPNERLIRHYVSVEILDRPTRVGKEAIYNFRQLLQFVAARILINDGWPLAKVAEQTYDVSESELLRMATSYQPKTAAQELVKKFKDPNFSYADMAMKSSAPPKDQKIVSFMQVDQSLDDDFDIDRSMKLLKKMHEREQAEELKDEALARLGNKKGVVEKRAWHEIDVTHWLRVSFRQPYLVRMDKDTAERIGEAITQVLKAEVARRQERKR